MCKRKEMGLLFHMHGPGRTVVEKQEAVMSEWKGTDNKGIWGKR